VKTIHLFVILLLLSSAVFAQDTQSPAVSSTDSSAETTTDSQTIPEALRRPERGETPRYPRDVVIGELGQGSSPAEAYKFAQDLLSSLVAQGKDAQIAGDFSSILTESLLDDLGSIEPQSYRLGSGRVEEDGSVSYLVRFIGQQESITGELFLRQAGSAAPGDDSASDDAKWLLDDLVLEQKRVLTEIRDSYRFDFSPYERFY